MIEFFKNIFGIQKIKKSHKNIFEQDRYEQKQYMKFMTENLNNSKQIKSPIENVFIYSTDFDFIEFKQIIDIWDKAYGFIIFPNKLIIFKLIFLNFVDQLYNIIKIIDLIYYKPSLDAKDLYLEVKIKYENGLIDTIEIIRGYYIKFNNVIYSLRDYH